MLYGMRLTITACFTSLDMMLYICYQGGGPRSLDCSSSLGDETVVFAELCVKSLWN